MTHAYSELYLSDAQDVLANVFDYAINDCKISLEMFSKIFVTSKYCKLFEIGNPSVLSGMSGVELALKILKEVYEDKEFAEPVIKYDRTPEFWAGYYLAYYQWYSNRKIKDIFRRIAPEEILSMYSVFHEMDIMQFVDSMEFKYKKSKLETKLKTIRESRKISQSKLAELSGVSLRMIQLYEQKVNDIDKAQAKTLDRLAQVLGCSIEDLLENN